MSFIDRCIRYPVTVSVVVILIMLFGLLALRYVPVQLTPNVDQPIVTVTTTWFGASPQEIIKEIVEEQEDVLKATTGLREITSSAIEGQATVRLEFDIGIDKEAAINEVRDKLRRVPNYPENVDEPRIDAQDEQSRDYIAWFVVRRIPDYTSTGTPAPGFERGDITKLGTFFNEIVKPILERADGVSEIQVLGGREREVQVRVDLDALAGRGISINQMAQALREQNLDATAGTFDEGKRRVAVRVLGQYIDTQRILDTVIASTADGRRVYVRDVASVEIDFKKEISFVHSRGEPVIALNAQREFGSNVIEVMNNLRTQVEEVNRITLGQRNWGIEIQQVYDQTVYINQSIANARNDLILGAVLAGVVLMISLRSIGATMVVITTIPIAVVGTFLGMALFGRSLNVISMAGLVFAVGFGIDNAIVVLENIFRHREMGKDRIRAAVDGASEVWGAIVAASLTNIAVFLPIVFIEAEAGQLFRDLAIALSISFFFYLFLSPTVIPVLASLFLRRVPSSYHIGQSEAEKAGHATATRDTRMGRLTSPIGRLGQKSSGLFYNVILRLTQGLMLRVALIALMIGASVGVSLLLIPPRDYLPSGNQNFVFGLLMPPPGYNPDEFRSMASNIEGQLKPWWDIHNTSTAETNETALKQLQEGWRSAMDQFAIPAMQQQIDQQRQSLAAAGTPAADIDEAVAFLEGMVQQLKFSPPPPAIEHFFFVIFGNSVFMGGSSADAESVSALTTLFNGTVQQLPGTIGFFFQIPIFNLGSVGNSVDVAVYGPDNDAVRQSATMLMVELMQNFGGFPQSNPPNFSLGRDEVQLVPQLERIAQADVGGVSNVRAVAQAALDGLIVGDFRELGTSIDLTIVSNRPRTIDQLPTIPVASGVTGSTGPGAVPMGNLVDFIRTTAAAQINHTEQQPSVTLSVQIPSGMTLQQGSDLIQNDIVPKLRNSGMISPDVNIGLRGSADKLQQFMRAFIPGFLLAALVTYLLLAALYENFLHPFTILASVPFALAGGFAALGLVHLSAPEVKLDVLTMLGFVILIGTIINNPILIVHQALNFLREGMPRREAIARSTQTRVRPIFMSVVTSVAALTPLVLGGGAGSELYRGLGTVVVGGLIVSTLFTLILTPVMMSLVLDGWHWIRGDKKAP